MLRSERKLHLAVTRKREKIVFGNFWSPTLDSGVAAMAFIERRRRFARGLRDALGQIEFLRLVPSSTPEEWERPPPFYAARSALTEAAKKSGEKLPRPQSPDAATRQMNGQTCFFYTKKAGEKLISPTLENEQLLSRNKLGLSFQRSISEFYLTWKYCSGKWLLEFPCQNISI